MERTQTSRWIAETRSGNRAALEQLLAEQLPALRAFIRLRVGAELRAHESASDLAQSVCREVLADLSRFEYRGEAPFRAWLFETALHKIVDRERHWRALKRGAVHTVELHEDAARASTAGLLDRYSGFCTPSRVAMAREELERIEGAFDRLSDEHRRVITLARIARLSHAEVAVEMGRTEDSVRNLLSRALAKLSTLLVERPPREHHD